MAQEVHLYPKAVYDQDDKTAQVNATGSTNDQKLVFNDTGLTFFRTRTGRKARLAFVANAVDAGGESTITFHVRINGALCRPPYDSFQFGLGVTYSPGDRMQAPIDLPQNAMVEVWVDNSGATAYNAFARLRVEYEEA